MSRIFSSINIRHLGFIDVSVLKRKLEFPKTKENKKAKSQAQGKKGNLARGNFQVTSILKLVLLILLFVVDLKKQLKR